MKWFRKISCCMYFSTLCDPMNHSMPGLPVHHQLPEFTETQIHRVSDAIQPSFFTTEPPRKPSQFLLFKIFTSFFPFFHIVYTGTSSIMLNRFDNGDHPFIFLILK